MAGNANSGRPSSAQELANYKLLWDILTEDTDVPALQKKIDSGKYSPMDRIRLMVSQGDKDWLKDLFIRFFPQVQVIDARSDQGLISPEQIQFLAERVKRIAVELHQPELPNQPGDVVSVQTGNGGTEPPALRADVPAPLPDQPSTPVPPGDSPAPEGPEASSNSPS